MSHRYPVFMALLLLLSACHTISYIPGTKVADTKANRDIVQRIEEYRLAMQERDAPKLLAMAHPNYYEDSGTPVGSDDYGYPGLKRVLDTRLPAIRALRYALQIRNITLEGKRATVDIRYDVSFQIATELGDRWTRKQDDKRMELEYDGGRWLFLSGY